VNLLRFFVIDSKVSSSRSNPDVRHTSERVGGNRSGAGAISLLLPFVPRVSGQALFMVTTTRALVSPRWWLQLPQPSIKRRKEKKLFPALSSRIFILFTKYGPPYPPFVLPLIRRFMQDQNRPGRVSSVVDHEQRF
jgi:hypothetical protein